ncbi:hypothetical protein GHT06_003727 [Daphnia sinensis]|uniref:Tandem-95 repeat protein n=1 Tax=Daphnia sinensis TaxID=1820382 RepID=A0AAD5PJU5_9CRUS|nr:hypothetical protein GHT06_003727 [Daphnia sinensis]
MASQSDYVCGEASSNSVKFLFANLPTIIDDNFITLEDTPVSGVGSGGSALTVTEFTIEDLVDSDGNPIVFNPGETQTIPNVGTIVVNADVNPVNDPPLASDDVVTTNAGVTASGNVLTNDTDLEGDDLSISKITVDGVDYAVGTPHTMASGILTVNADGTFTFEPASGFTGDVPAITYTLSDGTGTDTGVINIYVAPVNDAPVANPDTNTVAEDTPATGNVITNDIDDAGTTLTVTQISFEVDGTTYTYPAGTLSTIPGVGTVVVNADGTYTFTPDSNWNGEVPTISYTLSDNDGATVVGTLDITVTPVNDEPIAVNDDNLVTPEDTPMKVIDPEGLPITVTTFTIDGIEDENGDPVVFTAGTTEAIIGTDGAFTFTPVANYSGTVPVVTYTAQDSGGAEATATLNLSVTPVNDPPLAVNDLFTVADNTATDDQTPKTGNVLTNDSDPEGDTIKVTTFTVAGVSYPAGTVVTVPNIGNIILNEDGTFTFTPLPGNDDPLEISYTVTDSKGLSSTATLKIEVELLDSDGDGVPDFQEKIDGTNIYDSCMLGNYWIVMAMA